MSTTTVVDWQRLFHATLYKFSDKGRDEVLRLFHAAPGHVSAKCVYDSLQDMFEISCLAAEAKQALSDIATIVKKYIDQEPVRTKRALKFNISYAANVTEIYAVHVAETPIDRDDAFELENEFQFHDGSTAGNSGVQLFWAPESPSTDLTAVASPKNLKEVGRLTSCELSLDSVAGRVVILIKNHHDNDEAAMMKMTIIERNHCIQPVISHVVKTQKDHAYRLQFYKLERLTDGTLGRVLLPSDSSLNNAEDLPIAYVCRYLKYHDQQFVLQKRNTNPIAQKAGNIWESLKLRNIGDNAPAVAKSITVALPQAASAAKVRDVENWMQGLDAPDNVTIDAIQVSQLTPTEAARTFPTKEQLTSQKPLANLSCASVNKENLLQKAYEPFAVNAHPWEKVERKSWAQKIVVDQRWGDGPRVIHGASGAPKTSRASNAGSKKRGNSGGNTVRNQLSHQTRQPALLDLSPPIDTSSREPVLVPPPPGYTPRSLGLSTQKSPPMLASNHFGSAELSSQFTKIPEVPGPVPPVAIRRFEGKKSQQDMVTPSAEDTKTGSINSSAAAGSTEIYMVLKQVPAIPDWCPVFEKPAFADTGVVVERLQTVREADSRIFRRTRHNTPSPAVSGEAQRMQDNSAIGPSLHNAEDVATGIRGKHLSSSDILEHLEPINEDEVGQRPFMHTIKQKKPSKTSRKPTYVPVKQVKPNLAAAMVSLRASYAETTAGKPLRNTKQLSQGSGQPSAAFCGPVSNSTYPLGDLIDSASKGCQSQQRSTVPVGSPNPENIFTTGLEQSATLPSTPREKAITASIRVDPTLSLSGSIAHHAGTRAIPLTDTSSRVATPKFAQSVRAGLEIARTFSGIIIIESEIGQILLGTIPKNLKEAPFDASELPSAMGNIQAFQRSCETFTSHLSTSSSDFSALLDRLLLDCPLLTREENSENKKAVYEFICTCSDKRKITIIVDAITEASVAGVSSYVIEKENLFAATYLHFPQRVWDARMLVKGEVRASLEEYEGAKTLVDSVYVRVSETESIPEIHGRDGGTLTVDCVRIRSMLDYTTKGSPGGRTHFVRFTKIQELTVCRYESDMLENRGLFCTAIENDASMIADHRMWFEASVGMNEAKEFKENTNLELGGEVGWTVDDVVTESDLGILESLTVALVERMDSVGYHNKGIGAKRESKLEKQRVEEKKAEEERVRKANAPW